MPVLKKIELTGLTGGTSTPIQVSAAPESNFELIGVDTTSLPDSLIGLNQANVFYDEATDTLKVKFNDAGTIKSGDISGVLS